MLGAEGSKRLLCRSDLTPPNLLERLTNVDDFERLLALNGEMSLNGFLDQLLSGLIGASVDLFLDQFFKVRTKFDRHADLLFTSVRRGSYGTSSGLGGRTYFKTRRSLAPINRKFSRA